MPNAELKIERTGPAHDSDVRLTVTIPWSQMSYRVMEDLRQQWGRLEGFKEDAVLIAGAIPAVVQLVGHQRPQVMWGPLNAYAWELDEQRIRLSSHRRGDRNEEAWLDAKFETVSVLLRELRFAEMTASGAFKRSELLKEERLLGGVEHAERQGPAGEPSLAKYPASGAELNAINNDNQGAAE